MQRLALLLVAVAGQVACYSHPHVRLRAPEPDASAARRRAAYDALKPAEAGRVAPLGHPYRESDAIDYLVLGGGEQIYRPDDLIAVVEPDSPTARAARRHAAAERRSRAVMYVGGGVGLVGGLVLAGGLAEDVQAFKATGVGLVGAGVLLAAIAGLVYFPRMRTEREAAFGHYEVDLRQRLRLCVQGFDLVDCSAP
jgi:hypothetical protein